MKSIGQHLKAVALFFVTVMLCQSCTVYKASSVTLDEASKSNTKVRVMKTNGEHVKYSRIVALNEGHFYGVQKVNGLSKNMPIHQDDIVRLNLKNRETSAILNIGIAVVIIAFIWSAATFNGGYGL
jgi:hypothetical protein